MRGCGESSVGETFSDCVGHKPFASETVYRDGVSTFAQATNDGVGSTCAVASIDPPNSAKRPLIGVNFFRAAESKGSAALQPPHKASVPRIGARYVRPTPRERSEQLYAYYVGKGLLANMDEGSERVAGWEEDGGKETKEANMVLTGGLKEKEEEERGRRDTIAQPSAPSPFPSLNATTSDKESGSRDGRISASKSGGGNNLTSAAEEAMRTTSRQGVPRKCSLPHPDETVTEKVVLAQLRQLVNDYEKRYHRKFREWSSRSFPVAALSPLDVIDHAAQGGMPGSGGLHGKGGSSPVAVLSADAVEERQCDWTFSCLQRSTPSKGVEANATSMGLHLPRVLNSLECHDGAPCERLEAEQRRRSQAVRQHIVGSLNSLERLSSGKRCAHLTDDGVESSEGFPFGHLTGVTGKLFEMRLDATPHVHVKKLLECLLEIPALQKCAEAAARLATFILMHSLPRDIYEGDPEDYRTLQAGMCCATATSNPSHPLATPMESSPVPHISKLGKHGPFDHRMHCKDSPISLQNITNAEERYFLHQDSFSLTQALQCVAQQKGCWLSSTMPTMPRPPLHACGLPLRTARDTAMRRGLSSAGSVVGVNAGPLYDDKSIPKKINNDPEENISTCTSELFLTEKQLQDTLTASEVGTHIDEDVEDYRPKMLAPLLIISHGGYGVAPFSVCDTSSSLLEQRKRQRQRRGRNAQREVCVDTYNVNEGALATGDNSVLSAMSNFMLPDPSLLPLHSVMQVIYQSVRNEQLIPMDEASTGISPVLLELLMDLVDSYEDLFQSILQMSFQKEPKCSFFVQAYRETLLSWASIAVCEAACGHATERAGSGPGNVLWASEFVPQEFSEEQLEAIALSGLIEKTFPSMTEWAYDESPVLRTIEKLRSLVLQTIGSVKGELYFFITGIDSRSAVLEQYRDQMLMSKARRKKVQAEAEEQMQLWLRGDDGGPLSFSKSDSFYRLNKLFLRALSTDTKLSAALDLDVSVASHPKDHNDRSQLVTSPVPSPSVLKPQTKKCQTLDTSAGTNSKLHVYPPDSASSLNHPQEKLEKTIEFQSMTSCGVSLNHMSFSSPNVFGPTMCEPAPCQSPPATGLLKWANGLTKRLAKRAIDDDVPDLLKVRTVRRELISLKLYRHRQGVTPAPPKAMGRGINSSPFSSKTKTCRNPLPSGPTSSLRRVVPESREANVISPQTSVLDNSSSLLLAAPASTGPPNVTAFRGRSVGTNVLTGLVGRKHAGLVDRLRKACENTAQFLLNSQDPRGNERGGNRSTLAESQWYALGSAGFYEFHMVACIKRSRQVAAFDLHHISPVIALGMCVQRDYNRGRIRRQDESDQQQQQLLRRYKHRAFKPRELRLGENIMPWTL